MQFQAQKIIVHHDGVSRKGPSFAIVNEYHKSIGFPISSLGYYVGYHYWIERDGKTIQARSEDEVGAHTRGQNYTSLGVGLAGNFDKELPTKEQVDALGKLLDRLCTEHTIPLGQIFPHRKYAEKTCYGSRLTNNWASVTATLYRQNAAKAAAVATQFAYRQTAAQPATGIIAALIAALKKLWKAVFPSKS